MSKWLLAAPALPAATIAAAQSQDKPKPSAFASCIAASEASLSAEERARLEKGIASLEDALRTIREFKLPSGADPAFRFTAMKSREGRS